MPAMALRMHYAPVSAADEDALGWILSAAFGSDPALARDWFDSAGRSEVRSVRTTDAVVGGLLLIPMGQYFGGRRVSMIGVAGVGVRHDRRRRGVASFMMTEALREMMARGAAISTLYGATQTLYRRVGYEAAGSRFRARLQSLDLRFDARELTAKLVEPADLARVQAFYDEVAPARAGFLARGPYIWPRQHGVRFGQRADGLLFEDAHGNLEGYVFYRLTRGEVRGHCEVSDFLASTARGHRQAWSALTDMGSIVDDYLMYTAPHDPAYLAHADPRFRVEHVENWMVRVVDVRRALLERGWPRGLSVRLELELRDDVLPENAGRLTVEIADGRAEVVDGGRGSIQLDVGGLAQLYTGFADPWTVAALDRLSASAADLEALAAAFAGPLPWMPEMF
jgi:predicted acetyltransferase